MLFITGNFRSGMIDVLLTIIFSKYCVRTFHMFFHSQDVARTQAGSLSIPLLSADVRCGVSFFLQKS